MAVLDALPRGREDQPLRHRRARGAADAGDRSVAVAGRGAERERASTSTSIGAVTPSLEDVFLDVVERVAEARVMRKTLAVATKELRQIRAIGARC